MTYRVVHIDARRKALTLERNRRWFRGRYLVITAEDVWYMRAVATVDLVRYP